MGDVSFDYGYRRPFGLTNEPPETKWHWWAFALAPAVGVLMLFFGGMWLSFELGVMQGRGLERIEHGRP